MQKKNKKIIKFTIAVGIIILLLLLLIILTNISNKQNKLGLYENTPAMLVGTEPNAPKLSAGMIPIKWNGTNFVITTKDDPEWHNSKPAYMMLNDGYYKSELERGIEEQQLMQNSVGVGVHDDPSIRGTIFMWIPRFVYNEAGEIGYIKEETTPGEGWTLPDLFMYKIEDETKPDFSLPGVWIQKDVDLEFASKVTQMNQEESIYGFIANTKVMQITYTDTIELQKYVGVGVLDDPSSEDTTTNVGASIARPQITDPTNQNRIILKIINTNQVEPIKASITHNTVDSKIEIRVTYTSNGINKILNEYGEVMSLTEENGIIQADTGTSTLGIGTYKFTVIDNKGNKKELSIEPTINSLFKVAYINGTDNMDNLATYNKSNQTVSSTENTLLNQIKAQDTTKTYSRAIKDTNGLTTAVSQRSRTSEDEQKYLYRRYSVKYDLEVRETYYRGNVELDEQYGYIRYQNLSEDTDGFKWALLIKGGVLSKQGSTIYTPSFWPNEKAPEYNYRTHTSFYKWVLTHESGSWNDKTTCTVYKCTIVRASEGTRNSYLGLIVDNDGAKVCDGVDPDTYWYEKGDIIPRYTLYKYDQNLNLKSTYDVDTKTLTTTPIDISNRGRNKIKLTLTTTGNNYKTYISNGNTNWQEVTDITSGTPKELDVDGWNSLYIKIETNTSRIDNIDIAYYKD